MNDVPKFLVEWSSPWDEFRSAIRPAMGRSPDPLAGEAPTGLFPYRGLLISWLFEGLLLLALIVIPGKLESMHPTLPPVAPKYDIIYFSGDELPRTEDVGGAQSGRSGRSGGQEAHHRTQTIKVSRGNSLRETVVDAPKLNLPVSNSAVANLLAYKPVPGPAPAEGLTSSRHAAPMNSAAVPPSPDVQRDRMKAPPSLNAGVVAPAPEIRRDQMQKAPVLSGQVVPPSPSAPQRNLQSLRLPGSQVAEVVPPPVSAREQVSNRNALLTLPAPGIVAPPPTVTRETAALGPGYGPGELHKQVVPPPVQLGGSSDTRPASLGSNGVETSAVVPPPVQLSGGSGQRQGSGGLVGTASVVPPPVQVGGSGSGTGRSAAGLSGGGSVVPPPPSVAGTDAVGGQGRGNRGAGFGGPMDAGSVAAPANSGGSSAGNGVVVSSQPGSKVGAPGNGGPGSLAMSPSGGTTPGIGGSGGGSGIGHGDGPGSGFSGPGPGAGKEGAGHGSDTAAHGGISPYPGPGGAGTASGGKPAMPGVSVQGGTQSVTLPSFGQGGDPPSDPSHSTANSKNRGPDITVIATSRSGGAFNYYGMLKGDRTYTNYIDTSLGMVSFWYADPASAQHPYGEELSAPLALRKELPEGLPKARLVIACNLDATGLLRNVKVLEPGPAVMTSKVVAALSHWKFTPVLRGGQPIEVTAILGFNIDTNDRF